jgi:hypothetical protein
MTSRRLNVPHMMGPERGKKSHCCQRLNRISTARDSKFLDRARRCGFPLAVAYRFVFCVKTLPAIVLAVLVSLVLSSVLAAVAATLGEVVLLVPAWDKALAATDLAAALAPGVLNTCDALVATLGEVTCPQNPYQSI